MRVLRPLRFLLPSLVPAAVPLLICLSAAASGESAGVEVALLNGDRVRGTIFPATQVETFDFVLPRGARLKVVAKPKKTRSRTTPPPLSLRLLDRFGRDVGADSIENGGKKARVTGFEVEESGVHYLKLGGDRFDIGDYTLVLAWKSPKKFKQKGVDTSEGIQNIDFAADSGAVLVIKAKASKNSPALPVVTDLVRIEDGREILVHTFAFPPRPTATFKATTGIVIGGDHRLKLRDGGGIGGPVDVSLKLKKSSRRRDVRLTDDRLDVPPSDVRIVATVLIDDDGGEGPPGAPIVKVPVNAVSKLTPVQIGVGDPFDGPERSGLLPAGDTVFVGPTHLEFDFAVDVELPFNASGFAGDTSNLRVQLRDETGLTTPIFSFVVDANRSVVTAEVRRGGTVGAFRLLPPPAPTSLTPFIGQLTGGYTMSLGGSNFRDERDAFGELWLQVTIDGEAVETEILSISPTLISFIVPPHLPGRVTYGILDRETGLIGELASNSFQYR